MRTFGFMAAAIMAMATPAVAQPIKIGIMSTFSGPSGIIGQDLLDGMKLGLKTSGGRLGGKDVQLVVGDDDAKPETARQLADKMVESDHVQIIAGMGFTNALLAAAPPILKANVLLISAVSGPSNYAGAQCNPNFFNTSRQNDSEAETVGQYLTDTGIKRLYISTVNYAAAKDIVSGLKRTYKGEIVAEIYSPFGQLDYSAEIAQIRAAKPQALFYFYPGGMGVNFLKQFALAGLKADIPVYTESGLDQTTLDAVGDAALGVYVGTQWSAELDNPANKAFLAAFAAEYRRAPSIYAARGYDTMRLLDRAYAGVADAKDTGAVRKALETVKLDSTHGAMRFNTNHFPVEDFYATQVTKDAAGAYRFDVKATVFRDYPDPYVAKCQMTEPVAAAKN